MRFLSALTTFVALAQYVRATGVTLAISGSPAGGLPLTITFTDAGGTEPLANLVSGTVNLYIGGNNVGTDSQVIQPLGAITYPSTTWVSPAIVAANAQSLANGFYIGVTSAAKDGSTVLNYSPRFSISGMTGTTAAAYIAGAQSAGSASPASVVQAAAAAAPAAADGGAPQSSMFNVAYQSQMGLTKYAPMQSVPPTRITQKNATPLFPTSAYTIATTFLGKPTILTTITQGQTVSYSSVENTAAPQSHPQQANMKRFLERWKD